MGASPEAVQENVRAQVQKREQEEEQNRKKFELPPYLKHFGVSLNGWLERTRFRPPSDEKKRFNKSSRSSATGNVPIHRCSLVSLVSARLRSSKDSRV